VIDDDPSVTRSIELFLRSGGYECDGADLGETGIRLGQGDSYDLIILDLSLPDVDGLKVLRYMRSTNVRTPILVLSGLSQLEAKVEALTAGADDYLTKPFDNAELLARIEAIVRRSSRLSHSVVRAGGLSIDVDAGTVSLNGQQIHLTRREYAILELLALRKGGVLTKEMIMSHVYGGMDEPKDKIIDVYICKIRQKLASFGGEDCIETVWGRGYTMAAEEAGEPQPSELSKTTISEHALP
jgi:two-component system cell cycle response regulator CtrA